jgi:hypothetical protein
MVLRFDILLMLTFVMAAGTGSPRRLWAVYYSDVAQPKEFRGYDLVVFDGDVHPPLKPISANGSVVLGYLSLCEVERHRKWFTAARDSGLLVGENPNWRGSYFIDLRDARWRKIVVGQLVPEVLAQGFQGLFLDTLDDAADLERRDPRTFRGMKAAAVQLVRDIRTAAPTATLMVNRGYDLLPEIARSIDIVLGESVYGTYDFAAKTYRKGSRRGVPAAGDPADRTEVNQTLAQDLHARLLEPRRSGGDPAGLSRRTFPWLRSIRCHDFPG